MMKMERLRGGRDRKGGEGKVERGLRKGSRRKKRIGP